MSDADWTTTGVTVEATYDWRKDERVFLGHRAGNRVQVTTRDPSLVGRLFTDAVEVASARVGGPEWIVEQVNPAHLEACRSAAADAAPAGYGLRHRTGPRPWPRRARRRDLARGASADAAGDDGEGGDGRRQRADRGERR